MYDHPTSVVDQVVERLKTPVAGRTETLEVLTFKSPLTVSHSETPPRVLYRKTTSFPVVSKSSLSKPGKLLSRKLKLSPPSDDSDSETESDTTALPRRKLCVNLCDSFGISSENGNEEVTFEEEGDKNIWQSSPVLSKLEQQLKLNRMQIQEEFATVLNQTLKSSELEEEKLPGGWKRLVDAIEERNRLQAAEERRQWGNIEKQIFNWKAEQQKRDEERVNTKVEPRNNSSQSSQPVQISSLSLHTGDTKDSALKKNTEHSSVETNVQLSASKESVVSNAESIRKLSDSHNGKSNSVVLANVAQSSPYKEQVGIVRGRNIITSSSALLEASTCYQSLEDLRQTASSFLKDASTASYRLHLKKRINLAANQIAASQKQILNKAYDIVDTLRKAGQSSKESQAYCFLCVIERLVEEGEKQVALHGDSAFAIAAVIIAVTAEFSELKQLFLAQFHNVCIFTIPAYAMRSKHDSVEKYWQSMGWKDGETLERFYERMSGYLALHAAVIQTEIPSLANNLFGIDSGWTWLARVVNMKPRRFTAFVLISFLEIAGYALNKHYGRQFEKLLRLIQGHILPNLPSNAPPGPTARLQSFIEDFYNNKTIKEPQGRQLPTTDAENEDYSNGF
ncbi:Nucleoporin GLE1 [Galdieria sulphuraria]|nr:Nucleoporin GLE1 [Galdieria sulphuraria]